METVEHLIVGAGPAGLRAGEEVGRGILDPGYRRPSAPAATLSLLERLARWRPARSPMANWFLAG